MLWAGTIAINHVQFSYETPNHKLLTLYADNMHGHEKIIVNNATGSYEQWHFKAKKLIVDTIAHIVHFENNMVLMSVPETIEAMSIAAHTGTLNLRTHQAFAYHTKLNYRNLQFVCDKATFNQKSKKIRCWNGRLSIYSHR